MPSSLTRGCSTLSVALILGTCWLNVRSVRPGKVVLDRTRHVAAKNERFNASSGVLVDTVQDGRQALLTPRGQAALQKNLTGRQPLTSREQSTLHKSSALLALASKASPRFWPWGKKKKDEEDLDAEEESKLGEEEAEADTEELEKEKEIAPPPTTRGLDELEVLTVPKAKGLFKEGLANEHNTMMSTIKNMTESVTKNIEPGVDTAQKNIGKYQEHMEHFDKQLNALDPMLENLDSLKKQFTDLEPDRIEAVEGIDWKKMKDWDSENELEAIDYQKDMESRYNDDEEFQDDGGAKEDEEDEEDED